MTKINNAFSLVEMSVVLIIIGILVASATAAGKMIANSKLRKVVQKFEQYNAATNSFYGVYGKLPGDLDIASKYWTSCVTVGSNPCDGDGDNVLDRGYEDLRFWHHLTLSKILPGNYPGSNASGDADENRAGENVPASIFQGGCYTARSVAEGFGKAYNAGILIGKEQSGSICKNAIFLAKEAEFIDFKLDNGIPNTGKIMSRHGYDMTSGECASSGAYNTTETEVKCYTAYVLEIN